MRLLVVIILMIGIVQCKKVANVLEDFANSPWVVNSADPSHVEEEGRRAYFSGSHFAMSRDIPGGEVEYRVYHGNVAGMETSIKRNGERGLFYRQVTDGRKLIVLVYDGTRGMLDCDVQRDTYDIDNFLAQFLMTRIDTISFMRREQDSIDMKVVLGSSDLIGEHAKFHSPILQEPYATLTDIETLHELCVQKHHQIKNLFRKNSIDVDEIRAMADVEDTEVSRKFIPRRVKRTRREATQGKSRAKRDLLMPDTNWCGAGSSSDGYDDVNQQGRATDRCCREHDHCPYFVEGFSSDYGLFNYYFSTVSHCYCDETFRTCLKTAGTEQSEMVGKVYFNILGMKCFEFETKEVCTERSFWGRCTKTETQVVAEIKGSLDWD